MTAAQRTTDEPLAPETTGDLLRIRDLCIEIKTAAGPAVAVDGVSLEVSQGEVLGIVGESGSGKTLTVLAIMGLLQAPVVVRSGEITFGGRELARLPEGKWRALRGKEIAMIFQEPLTSLDGAFTVGHLLTETVRAHERVTRREARRRAVAMLERVGIGSAERRLSSYPHELSGGMRQRVMIAMALLLGPRLLLADEPVTALDVTTQAQILELILDIQNELDMGVVFISHDLGVVLDVADRVAVMYAGQVVEVAPSADLFARPQHPYSHGLLRSKLSLLEVSDRVAVMPGQIPGLLERPPGCRFAPRCANRIDACTAEMPKLLPSGSGRLLRCFNPIRGDGP